MKGRPLVAALLVVVGAVALPASGRAAVPSCAIADQFAPEGDSGVRVVELRAICAGPLEQSLVYSIKTSDGTAVAPGDYQAVDTTAGASAGDTVLPVFVAIVGDTVHEGDETLNVTVGDPSGGVTFSRATATITILDNEEPEPVCTVPDVSFPEGDSGTAVRQFQIACDRRLPEDLAFHVLTADGTATAGTDYAAIDGPGSVVAGQTAINAGVTIFGDRVDEPDETFAYSVTDEAGLVTFTTGTITITDDDEPAPPPCILLSDTAVPVDAPASTPTRPSIGSPPERLTMHNCADGPVNVLARGTDATGDPGTWQLTDGSSGGPIDSTCDLGLDRFREDVTLFMPDGTGDGTFLGHDDKPLLGADLFTPFVLDPAATQEFLPYVDMPCVGSAGVGAAEPMTQQITLTAVALSRKEKR